MRKQVSITENLLKREAERGTGPRVRAPRAGGPESVGTLARGLDVLELFAAAGPELTQKQISESLALPMPTVHRLVALLTERGWLSRDPGTRRLRLGLELTRLVAPLLGGLRVPELARPYLSRLASDVNETVNLAILQGPEVVYLVSEAAARLLTARVAVGMRLPAHCTALGKCLLAQLPGELARAALGNEPYERRTERTLTTWRKLSADLASIRDTGIAISEEEYEIGLVSIAAPVWWIDGPGTAAINVSLPAGRASDRNRKRLIRALVEVAGEIDRGVSSPGTRR